jgi:hypothetical protein
VSDELLRYIGPWNLHDATIERLEQEGPTLRVRIRAEDGQVISAEFRGVTQVVATAAEGMLLYAVAEMRSDGPQRRFVFVNWYDPGEEEELADLVGDAPPEIPASGIERQLEVMAEDVHFR